jgi:C-terminal processing protease CtpA/Prc
MKKLAIVFLLISVHVCNAQNNKYWSRNNVELRSSGVMLPEKLTPLQEKSLDVLCRVWGFLKYFHPAVAGDLLMNADHALFNVLPAVLQSPGEDSLQNLLVAWVDDLGEVAPSSPPKPKGKLFIEPTMQWLNSDLFLKEKLRSKLQYIFNNRYARESFFARSAHFGNPDFNKEFIYADARGEDGGMRLLTLFRFWNIIEYYFPSKNVTADDWDETLKKFIPSFAHAKTDSAYRVQSCRLVAAIHDTHALSIGDGAETQKYSGKYMLPVVTWDVEGFMTVVYYHIDSMQEKGILKPGDRIIAINGTAVKELVDSVKELIPSSNQTASVSYSLEKIGMSKSAENKLRVIRDGATIELTVTYMLKWVNGAGIRRFYTSQYPMSKMLDAETGYINLGKIEIDSLENIFKAFAGTKGIVIDIRNYPSAFMPFEMGKYIKPHKSEFVKFSKADYSLPGRFIITEPLENGEDNKNYYRGKIVILVDKNSFSQSEYTAMALRTAPNAVVMGSQTMGADGDISLIRLPGGLVTCISGLGVYYPDGRVTQGIGIIPDLVVKPTAKGFRDGKDEVLEAAVNYIHK